MDTRKIKPIQGYNSNLLQLHLRV